jgi:hypothetical protein
MVEQNLFLPDDLSQPIRAQTPLDILVLSTSPVVLSEVCLAKETQTVEQYFLLVVSALQWSQL